MKALALLLVAISFALPALAQDNNSTARTLVANALAAARKEGKCVAAAVVDDGGNLVAFERDACASIGGGETAIQKAKSANAFRKPTSAFAEAVKSGNTGVISATGVVAVAGGVPLELKGTRLGAIGVGGATGPEDEAFAKAAIVTATER